MSTRTLGPVLELDSPSISWCQVQDSTLLVGPLLQPVQVPVDDFPSFQCIDCTAHLGVICKLAEGASNSIVNVIDKDEKEVPLPVLPY